MGQKSKKCPFYLKIGTHSILRMLVFIPALVFWIFNPKPIFGQIWAKKFKVVRFAQNFTNIVSRRCWFLFWNSKPRSIFWANLNRKSRTVYFAWKLKHRVSRGCNCKYTEEGLEAKWMNNCIKSWLLLYFHHS